MKQRKSRRLHISFWPLTNLRFTNFLCSKNKLSKICLEIPFAMLNGWLNLLKYCIISYWPTSPTHGDDHFHKERQTKLIYESRNAIQHMGVSCLVGTWIFCLSDPSQRALVVVRCRALDDLFWPADLHADVKATHRLTSPVGETDCNLSPSSILFSLRRSGAHFRTQRPPTEGHGGAVLHGRGRRGPVRGPPSGGVGRDRTRSPSGGTGRAWTSSPEQRGRRPSPTMRAQGAIARGRQVPWYGARCPLLWTLLLGSLVQ